MKRLTRRDLRRLIESVISEEVRDFDPATPGIQARESDLDPGLATVSPADNYADLAQDAASDEASKVGKALSGPAGGVVSIAKIEYFSGRRGIISVIDDDVGPAYHLISGDSDDNRWENDIKDSDYREFNSAEKAELKKIGYQQYFEGMSKDVVPDDVGFRVRYIVLPLKD